MFEWGPIITAVICLVSGFIHARMACVGTPKQKVFTYIVVLLVIVACVLVITQLDGTPGDGMLRGQIAQAILLGIPIPLLAGIGLFAWTNPEKMVSLAESRKYMRQLKGSD
jgi:hypothetical protein